MEKYGKNFLIPGFGPLEFYNVLGPGWKSLITYQEVQLLFRICMLHAVPIGVSHV